MARCKVDPCIVAPFTVAPFTMAPFIVAPFTMAPFTATPFTATPSTWPQSAQTDANTLNGIQKQYKARREPLRGLMGTPLGTLGT